MSGDPKDFEPIFHTDTFGKDNTGAEEEFEFEQPSPEDWNYNAGLIEGAHSYTDDANAVTQADAITQEARNQVARNLEGNEDFDPVRQIMEEPMIQGKRSAAQNRERVVPLSTGDRRMHFLPPSMIYGAYVRKRGGRTPALYRNEVEQIRMDGRSTSVIAKHWGISEETVRRVKQIGRYAGMQYIPADEYERGLTTEGNSLQTPMKDFAPVSSAGRVGRPPKNRDSLTPQERREIAAAMYETAEKLAEKYKVSRSTIYNIRRTAARTLPDGMTLREAVQNDPRSDAEVARFYRTTDMFIRDLRNNTDQMIIDGVVYIGGEPAGPAPELPWQVTATPEGGDDGAE